MRERPKNQMTESVRLVKDRERKGRVAGSYEELRRSKEKTVWLSKSGLGDE
jgi:hypothetical protein